MKIVVLLATYNGEKYLAEQLDSILAQSGNFDIDIYVRDDGSTDQTVDIINSYLGRSRAVHLIDPKELKTGSSTGNFFELLKAVPLENYQFAAFSDQDDVWMPDKIESAIKALTRESRDCYLSDLYLYDSQRGNFGILKKSDPIVKFDYLFQGGSAGCTYLLTARAAIHVLNKIITVDAIQLSRFSHDWIIYTLTRAEGFEWFFDPDPKIRYRQHASNLYGASVGFSGVLKRVGLFRNGWYRANLKFNLELMGHTDSADFICSAIIRNIRGIRFYISVCRNLLEFRRKRFESICVAFLLFFGLL